MDEAHAGKELGLCSTESMFGAHIKIVHRLHLYSFALFRICSA